MVCKQVWDEVIFAGLDLCSKSGPNMLGKSRLHLGDVELPLQPRTHKVLGALKETHLFNNATEEQNSNRAWTFCPCANIWRRPQGEGPEYTLGHGSPSVELIPPIDSRWPSHVIWSRSSAFGRTMRLSNSRSCRSSETMCFRFAWQK